MDEKAAKYFIDGYGFDPRQLNIKQYVRLGPYFDINGLNNNETEKLQHQAAMAYIEKTGLRHKDFKEIKARSRSQSRSRSKSRSKSSKSNNKSKKQKPNV